jgi:hypothetical protein
MPFLSILLRGTKGVYTEFEIEKLRHIFRLTEEFLNQDNFRSKLVDVLAPRKARFDLMPKFDSTFAIFPA